MSRRVFVSVPNDLALDPTYQLPIKRRILNMILKAGFEPQEFSVSGLPTQMPWTFDSVNQVMQRCHGAVILGLERWQAPTGQGGSGFATAYNHYEGALALANQLPTLIIAERGIERQGIFYSGAGRNIVYMPPTATQAWFRTKPFLTKFEVWQKDVKARFDVFIGYCDQTSSTAQAIIQFLEKQQRIKVMDWKKHFRPGRTILEEVERASQSCLAGIFLFTRDDEVTTGNKKHAAPRDNVILEAGYFLHAKGKERALLICEKGVKVPADLGGNIYVELENRKDISKVKAKLQGFVQSRL